MMARLVQKESSLLQCPLPTWWAFAGGGGGSGDPNSFTIFLLLVGVSQDPSGLALVLQEQLRQWEGKEP